MPVPKYKTSRSKRDQRRGQIKITAPSLSSCSNCSALIRPHRVSPECGYYKGVEVVPTDSF